MREICERYGIPYNVGPLGKQFGSVVRKICRLALPGQGTRGTGLLANKEQQRKDARLTTAGL